MKAIMDLHTHTLAAGHAYSTLLENIDAALAMGLQYLGMSEHGPTSPGGPHNFFFSNYKVIPRIYDREENTGRVIPKPDGSLRLLCGVEANICSTNGELDLEERSGLREGIQAVGIPQTGGGRLFHNGLAGRHGMEGGIKAVPLDREPALPGDELLPGEGTGPLKQGVEISGREGAQHQQHPLPGAQI